jgi:hypothetical protein
MDALRAPDEQFADEPHGHVRQEDVGPQLAGVVADLTTIAAR